MYNVNNCSNKSLCAFKEKFNKPENCVPVFMHNTTPDVLAGVTQLFSNKSPQSAFLARQLLFSHLPASVFVENYLQDNEGNRQDLRLFPMMKEIYNQLPQKLLLKCSRKTLKSTLLSNIICLNMLRWNHYKMLYVAPQEMSAKYFSSNYVSARFDSPELKKIFVKGWEKNDVYEKIFADTHSAVLFKYAKEDATRCRGPATDHNIHDEVQDMLFDVLPIISETMALSKYKREFYAGTPLTTDNTINVLWLASTQLEWATKCTGCNHWNMLIIENNPMRMIQAKGLSCSKCDKLLDTTQGVWVSSRSNPKDTDLVGYHLAQPILPHFNNNEKEWKKIYQKVTDGKYGTHQVYNEVFGLAYDVGSKPITKEELKNLCVLGPMTSDTGQALNIFNKNRRTYVKVTTGVDWGVNMITSRTAVVHGAVRTDGLYEVFDARIFDNINYRDHIKEIAGTSNLIQSSIAADGGPDPIRAHELGEMTHPGRMLIVRYGNGKLVQQYEQVRGAPDWKSNRFVLHRSDCLSFTFRMLKAGKILFPKYSEMEQCMEDILAEFIEVSDGTKHDGRGIMNHVITYRHAPSRADDFLHALTFALVTAYVAIGDPQLKGPSSSNSEMGE